MNPESRYFVRNDIRFRMEDFGGVVYCRRGDRLHFFKSRLAVELLSLAGTGTVGEIAARLGTGSSNEQVVQKNVFKVLGHLKELDLVYELES